MYSVYIYIYICMQQNQHAHNYRRQEQNKTVIHLKNNDRKYKFKKNWPPFDCRLPGGKVTGKQNGQLKW